jgi:uncharacterized membrane protein
MTTTTLHPAAAAYMTRLGRAARSLPKAARQELLDDIEAHLEEATSAEMSETEVLSALDRLGEPEEIVAAQLPVRVQAVTGTKGIQEWSAIILLLFGGFIFGLGWLLGLVLLWSSRAWTTVDKLVGTFVLPGGLSGVLFILVIGSSGETCVAGPGQPTHCTGGPSAAHRILGIVLVVVVVLAPLVTAVYLARRARRPVETAY